MVIRDFWPLISFMAPVVPSVQTLSMVNSARGACGFRCACGSCADNVFGGCGASGVRVALFVCLCGPYWLSCQQFLWRRTNFHDFTHDGSSSRKLLHFSKWWIS